MRKSFGFIMAIAVLATLVATTAPAFAYTVTGDLSSSGAAALAGNQSYTGSLAGLFDVSANEAMYIDNGTSRSFHK